MILHPLLLPHPHPLGSHPHPQFVAAKSLIIKILRDFLYTALYGGRLATVSIILELFNKNAD